MRNTFDNQSADSPPHSNVSGEQTITVYGISNRTLNASRDAFAIEYNDARMDKSPHYFKETAQVSHDAKGDVHVVGLPKVELIDENEFQKQVDHSVKETQGKLGIFTHGIRNAPGDAGIKAIELAAATDETFVVEDWASTAPRPDGRLGKRFADALISLLLLTEQQEADYKNSSDSQAMINSSIIDLANRYGAQNIDLVAHSRGSMNQMRALGALTHAGQTVHSATFAHSDIDTNDFGLSLAAMSGATTEINILYSPKDKALLGSTIQNEGAKLTTGPWSVESIGRLGRLGVANNEFIGNLSTRLKLNDGYFHQARDDEPHEPTHHEMSASLVADMLKNESLYTVRVGNNENARSNRPSQTMAFLERSAARLRKWLHVKQPESGCESPEIQPYVTAQLGWTT